MTGVQTCALPITIALVAGLGFSLAPWVNWLLLVMLLLSVVTIFNRARRALEAVA